MEGDPVAFVTEVLRDPETGAPFVSETDLANALGRVSAYVSTRATEATKITPLNVEPAQNPHNRAPSRPLAVRGRC